MVDKVRHAYHSDPHYVIIASLISYRRCERCFQFGLRESMISLFDFFLTFKKPWQLAVFPAIRPFATKAGDRGGPGQRAERAGGICSKNENMIYE